MTRNELLDALLAERYNGGGWVTPKADKDADDDLTCARRRRQMVADYERLGLIERAERPGHGA